MDDGDVSEMFEDHREVQIDGYETNSDDEDTENEELVKRACITRSGRAVCTFVRLDLDSKYLRFTDNRQRSKILTYYRRSD